MTYSPSCLSAHSLLDPSLPSPSLLSPLTQVPPFSPYRPVFYFPFLHRFGLFIVPRFPESFISDFVLHLAFPLTKLCIFALSSGSENFNSTFYNHLWRFISDI